jgi:hypothetical protein
MFYWSRKVLSSFNRGNVCDTSADLLLHCPLFCMGCAMLCMHVTRQVPSASCAADFSRHIVSL